MVATDSGGKFLPLILHDYRQLAKCYCIRTKI
jgi:hypothetical protein